MGGTNSCCLCMSVSAGTMILGVFTWLSLFQELDHLMPLRLLLNVVAAICFLLMAMNDTEAKRRNFFWAYTVATVVTFIIYVFMANSSLEEEQPWIRSCHELYINGRLDDMHVST